MWRCKLCGGEIMLKEKTEENYEFTVDQEGERIEHHDEAYIDGDILSVIYECNNCGESTEDFEYIEEIADWIE